MTWNSKEVAAQQARLVAREEVIEHLKANGFELLTAHEQKVPRSLLEYFWRPGQHVIVQTKLWPDGTPVEGSCFVFGSRRAATKGELDVVCADPDAWANPTEREP